MRLSSLQGLLVEVVVVLARVLEIRLRRREASSWSNSSTREAKARRGKVLADPICFGCSGYDNFILAVSMQSTGVRMELVIF